MPHMVIDTRKDTPVYVQIMDQVRARVRDGELEPGSPLPSVRQLAAELELNPNTVAKAYSLLEREGIIRTRRRRGTFVAASALESAAEALERRLDRVVGRLIEETAHLGVETGELIRALKRRLDAGPDAKARRGKGDV